uniref:Double-stranded RNA-specific editase 1 n=1 Tax=Lepeophtheirus salmonis TaxID=72036 RepID=D3PIR6_LEPSM|nr:Double-stranded RNA-specific editase 1 [Lepeophtheirus salmonis]
MMNSSNTSSNEKVCKVTKDQSDGSLKLNKFTGMKIKTVPNIVKRKRTNYRLRKIIIPKSPLMVLNEIVGSVTYKFVESTVPSTINGMATLFTAQCTVEGRDYEASGPSKQMAKNLCAESAIQALVFQKCKDPNNFMKVDKEGNLIKPYQMEDETPWAQLSSLALFKLFNDWQASGHEVPVELLRPPTDSEVKVPPSPTPPVVTKVNTTKRPPGGSKKLPDNPTERHPVQLLNEIQGGVNYALVREKPTTPVIFVMSVTVDGVTFEGEGKNKKDSKRNCALAALKKIYGIVYPVRDN